MLASVHSRLRAGYTFNTGYSKLHRHVEWVGCGEAKPGLKHRVVLFCKAQALRWTIAACRMRHGLPLSRTLAPRSPLWGWTQMMQAELRASGSTFPLPRSHANHNTAAPGTEPTHREKRNCTKPDLLTRANILVVRPDKSVAKPTWLPVSEHLAAGSGKIIALGN